MNKKVYLCSPIIGERLRIPVDWGVNSGVFGRAQWFVNRQSSKGSYDSCAFVRLAAGIKTSDVGLCAYINY